MSVISFDLSMSNVGYSIFSDDGLFFMTGSIETNGKDSTPKRLKHIAKEMKKLKANFQLFQGKSRSSNTNVI